MLVEHRLRCLEYDSFQLPLVMSTYFPLTILCRRFQDKNGSLFNYAQADLEKIVLLPIPCNAR